ncbi:hypothetical protein AX17_005756 [Amanita inopinata Kibby_2008]|nr:hypothetical protein AX17_005756 [Amanita inopinata Kibby_2008]
MVRALFSRLSVFRGLLPRVTAPLLPVSRTLPSALPLSRSSRYFQRFPSRLRSFHTSPTRNPPTPLPPDASLSQRLKHLVKSYGWYALGVYLILSMLDFTVAFAGINLLGAEYVARIAASVKAAVHNAFHSKPVEPGLDEFDSAFAAGNARAGSGQEGLYAMLVLAYTVHKTLFLPVRVGLTAALTPRLVAWLSARGWAGGEGTRRAASEMRAKLRERQRSSGDD